MSQKYLTEKWVLPNQEIIISYIREIRKDVDEKLKNDPKIQKHLALWKKEYPIGLCANIRNEVLDRVYEDLKYSKRQSVHKIREFLKDGGKITPFWGIDKDMYFENAILIGDAVLDVANDTVTPQKDPIQFYPSLEHSPLKMIESFTKVAEVAEKYWGYDIYPNIYFPNLAPAYPILAIVKAHKGEDVVDGLIIQGDFIDFHERNLRTVRDGQLFGLAHDFIFKSKYSAKRLPHKMFENFLKSVTMQNFNPKNKEILRVSQNLKDTEDSFKNFSVDGSSNKFSSELLTKIKEMERVGDGVRGTILAKVRNG